MPAACTEGTGSRRARERVLTWLRWLTCSQQLQQLDAAEPPRIAGASDLPRLGRSQGDLKAISRRSQGDLKRSGDFQGLAATLGFHAHRSTASFEGLGLCPENVLFSFFLKVKVKMFVRFSPKVRKVGADCKSKKTSQATEAVVGSVVHGPLSFLKSTFF